MNNKCITHNQHHCIHAHNCNNPLHKQKIPQSELKDSIQKKTLPRRQPQIQTCKSGPLKPHTSSSVKRPNIEHQNARQKPHIAKSSSPDCKNLDYQKMFLNLNQKYKEILVQFQQMKGSKEKLEGQLKAEKLKNDRLEAEINKKRSVQSNFNQLQAQYQKISDAKKQLSASQHKNVNLQTQIVKLRNTIQNLTLEKQKIKEQSNRNSKKAGQIQDDLEKQNRQKQHLKRKLQESQSTIQDIQAQYKNLISKNKINSNQLVDEYEKKLRAINQKFSFSCDQLSESKKIEAKLKNKIKQLEEQLHQQILKASAKSKNSQPSKVEKELILLQQKSSKDNQKLRESLIQYEHDKRKLQQELSRTTTRLTDQIRQLEKLLRIKQTQVEQLENIKLTSQKQVDLLRGNKEIREKQRQKRQEQLKKAGIQIKDKNEKGGKSIRKQNEFDETGIKGTYSQAITIRHLQNRNAELEREINQLTIKLSIPGQTTIINDYNQFQKVIKENNKRIKDLILEKGKEMQSNSRLKVEVIELKNQLATRSTSLNSNPEQHLQQHKFRQMAHLKNSISELQFQLKQVRNQNYNINNQYSDYYIVKDDNENLKMKLQELVVIIQNLKKSIIHNSYQKQALLVDNHQLIDHLNMMSAMTRI